MALFLCRWPDATISIIEGDDATDAVLAVDELAGAKQEWMQKLNIRDFHIELALDKRGKLVLAPMEETIEDAIKGKAFPILSAVEDTLSGKEGKYTKADLAKIAKAIAKEEERVS
jgi:hypothetical protein